MTTELSTETKTFRLILKDKREFLITDKKYSALNQALRDKQEFIILSEDDYVGQRI